jgi:hypothetical protein
MTTKYIIQRSTYLIGTMRNPQLLNLPRLLRSPLINLSSIRPLTLQRLLHVLRIQLILLILSLQLQIPALCLVVQSECFRVRRVRFGFAFDGLGLLGLEFGELFDCCAESLFFGFGFGSYDFGDKFTVFS